MALTETYAVVVLSHDFGACAISSDIVIHRNSNTPQKGCKGSVSRRVAKPVGMRPGSATVSNTRRNRKTCRAMCPKPWVPGSPYSL